MLLNLDHKYNDVNGLLHKFLKFLFKGKNQQDLLTVSINVTRETRETITSTIFAEQKRPTFASQQELAFN